MSGTVQEIGQLAKQLGIAPEHVIAYGTEKAKLRHEAAAGRKSGRLILVTAMTPTGAGEGKTTTSISLGQGMASLGEKVCIALREPSLGPMFGMKGGATGGGKASLVPEEDINLHFTGDFHAITAAHNLLAALLDNHIHYGNPPEVDPRRISWRRVIDMNDRALRHVVIGPGRRGERTGGAGGRALQRAAGEDRDGGQGHGGGQSHRLRAAERPPAATPASWA